MKALVEIPLVGMIGTITIILSIVIPPTVVKTTIDKELYLTYKLDKAQNSLLTLFSLIHDGKNTYETLGEKAFFGSMGCETDLDCPAGYYCKDHLFCQGPTTEPLKVLTDTFAGPDYCISVEEPNQGQVATIDESNSEVLKRSCQERDINFKVSIVVPYNKISLIKNVTIGVK